MPRIYKGSESTLRLLIHTCNQEGTISDLKIALYTSDPSMAVEFTDRYTIEGNIVSLTVPNYAFGTMEDGVINYIAQGMIDDDTFLTERQSNYFLKTPANYTPTPIPGEVVLGELTAMIAENGVFEYTPNDVDAWSKATITVDVPTEGGGSCNLGEGEIFLTTNDVGTYEMYASDEGYDGWSKFIVTLEGGGAIKIYKASDLLEFFNNGGNIDYGAYYYVGGEITEIQEVNTQYGNATYVLDNGFKIYRGKWMDKNSFTSEDQIKVGAYIVVYGVIANYNGTLQFNAGSQVIAYQECEGGEIVSCNLEDKWVTPSMNDRDDNGYIVVNPSAGYDGLSRTVIDPQTIYNEGIEAGRAEGGEGGSCNLGILDLTLTDPYTLVKDASEDGYDGYNQVIVRPDNIIAQEKGNAINEFKNKMEEITITENGTYSIDDTELVKSIAFDGNSYFDTGIVPTENIKIEVCIKVTDGVDGGMGGIIVGGGIDPVDYQNYYGTENRGIAIGMGGGAIYGVWGATRSWNNPYEFEKTTTVVLQKTDDSWGWEGEKGSFGASTLYIGGYNRNGEEVEEKFTQSIVYVKIWTNRNDDSTLITYTPNTNGNFDANGAELQRLGDGTTTYVEENVSIYPNGFKRVEVNVPSVQEQVNGYYYCPLILGDSGFGEAAKSWNTDMVTFNDSDGNIIEDELYVPTYGNRNEFRTKTKAKFIQSINNTSAIGTMEFGSGVEYIALYSPLDFTNLTKLIIGGDVHTANFGTSTFPILKEIWSYSTTSEINVYFSLGSNFNGGGTLYLKNKDHETEWKNNLPSDWTIVYI